MEDTENVKWCVFKIPQYTINSEIFAKKLKVRKKAMIRNRYKQVPHLGTTIRQTNKNTRKNITHKRGQQVTIKQFCRVKIRFRSMFCKMQSFMKIKHYKTLLHNWRESCVLIGPICLLFVVSKYEFVTFPLVSSVRWDT